MSGSWKTFRTGVAVVAMAFLPAFVGAASWTGAPGPMEGSHVVVFRGSDFRGEGGKPVPLTKLPAAADGQAVAVDATAKATGKVRHAGKYTLWVRSAVPPKGKAPVKVSLTAGDAKPLSATINDGAGTPQLGGSAAYEAYAKAARLTGAEGKADKAIASVGKEKKNVVEDDLEKELLADLDTKKGIKRAKSWIDASRLEEQKAEPAFYWWKIGTVELKAGACTLEVAAAAEPNKAGPALVDIAFLTTSTEIDYPWLGDVDAPKASYVRFRIDEVPEGGATIQAGMRVHYEPWSVGPAFLNPSKLMEAKAEPHTQKGFTRWYRLQDVERAPAFGATEAHLALTIQAAKAGQPMPKGATQFAIYPHEDFVLREIGWQEPEGLNISMFTDFETYLHKLRTLRDHAREDYDKAIAATGGKIFPLTRGPLYFGNAWGAAGGEATDYMAKTLRLLGFNSVGQANEPLAYRKLYGWTSHAGEYWPPVHMPFDEEKSVKAYDDYYSKFFAKQKEFYEGVSIFQLADEPGEISRNEMTAPFWRFVKDKLDPAGRWVDPAGDSELATKRVDLSNCVLEGKVEQHGTWIGFRVATDKPGRATKYAYWSLGAVSQNRENNVAAGKESGKPGATPTAAAITRVGATLGRAPTEFKIVYEEDSAALYIKGKLIHQHSDLPTKGGFAIVGPPKAVNDLRLRTIRKDEHLTSASPDGVAAKGKSKDDLLDDLDDLTGDGKKAPDWAKPKSLEQFVREDCVFSGGMPEAHAGFRKWAKEQGLTPELFGQKTWDDVRMLTVAELVESPADARLFYWSRRYSGFLTPRMFALSSDAIQRHAPNRDMKNFVALSGHALYFPSTMPLDMFQLAEGSPSMMPGVSDWMSYGSWRWDSHQAVAFSVAMYNGGARRYGQDPASFPMMHCVWPSDFRAYTMLANQVKYVSFYNFGPSYAVTEGHWNDADACYTAVHNTANHAALVDDILATAKARPSRVALLYSQANEYWNPQSSFADKRALFLGLSHEYYQPELVTEDQVADGVLKNYDALYVLDPIVATKAQETIAGWVKTGGLLVTCADSLTKNEFNEPHDLVADLMNVERTFPEATKTPAANAPPTWPGPRFRPHKDKSEFRPHAVSTVGMPSKIDATKFPDGVTVRGAYDNGQPGWIEKTADKGRIVYFGHRLGLTYTAHALRRGGYETAWADTGRSPMVAPLFDRKVDRELVCSEPLVMATPMTNENGTVVMLYNMRPTPVKDLKVTLKSPKRPYSVKTFSDDSLEGASWLFMPENDTVVVTIKELVGPQMIELRNSRSQEEERLAELTQRTRELLESDDWRSLSAGAFFAARIPEGEFLPLLLPLLRHGRWEVREAAAEALAQQEPVSEVVGAVDAAFDKETDPHVLAELIPIAMQSETRSAKRLEVLLAHPDARVRRVAFVEFEKNLLIERSKRESQLIYASDGIVKAIEAAASDSDFRVRAEGIRALASFDSDLPLRKMLAAFDSLTADALDQPIWAEAVARQDVLFEHWKNAEFSGGKPLLLSVASRRTDAELAKRMTAQIPDLTAADAGPFVAAAIRQRDPALSKTLFAARESLPPSIAGYVPLILEYTFDARLGESLDDWAEFLSKQEIKAAAK